MKCTTSRRSMRSLGPAVRRRSLWGLLALAGGVLVLVLPSLVSGDVVLQFTATASPGGAAEMAPMHAQTETATVGGCTATATGSVPHGAGSPAGTDAIDKPRTAGCRSGQTFTFDPSIYWPIDVPVSAGHTIDTTLTVLSFTGTTAMVRTAHFYVTQDPAGPILTTTETTITRGAVTTAATSVGTVNAADEYGVGVVMTLTREAAVSTATTVLVLETYFDDGGVISALDEQLVTVTFTY